MAARFPRWSLLRSSRTARSLSLAEQREYHAVRLALILTAGVLQAGTFVASARPLPGDFYEHYAWLRRTLQPLARRSPTVACFIRLINLEGPRTAWDDPRVVRRHLRLLAANVEAITRITG